jgi:hypothetical protein
MAYVFSKPSGGSHRDRIENAACVGIRFQAQDGYQSGARVLGIYIDGAGPDGLKCDLGGTQTRAAVDSEAAGLEQLREHLGQQEALAEGLGGDDDRAAALRFDDGAGFGHLGGRPPAERGGGGRKRKRARERKRSNRVPWKPAAGIHATDIRARARSRAT